MQDCLYVAEGVNANGEITRAVEISLLGVTPKEAATFLPKKESDLSLLWQKWIDEWFVPVLAPRFSEIHKFAGNFHLNEAAAVDVKLDKELSAPLRTRSISAADAFLEGKSEMQHHPEWSRFSAKIDQGKTPGHVITLAALQSSLYHLALIPALISYAWFEFHSGLLAAGLSDPEEYSEIFLQIMPKLKLAVSAETSDNAGGESCNQLHAI